MDNPSTFNLMLLKDIQKEVATLSTETLSPARLLTKQILTEVASAITKTIGTNFQNLTPENDERLLLQIQQIFTNASEENPTLLSHLFFEEQYFNETAMLIALAKQIAPNDYLQFFTAAPNSLTHKDINEHPPAQPQSTGFSAKEMLAAMAEENEEIFDVMLLEEIQAIAATPPQAALSPARLQGQKMLAKISQAISETIGDNCQSLNPTNELQLQTIIIEIFKQAFLEAPELLWSLYSKEHDSPEAQLLIELAKNINGDNPTFYLRTLMGDIPNNIPDEMPIDQKTLSNDYVLLLFKNGSGEIISIENLKEQLQENNPITGSKGQILTEENAQAILSHPQLQHLEIKIINAKISDLKPTTITLLYNLAITGSTSIADRGDDPNQRELVDTATRNAMIAITDLQETDPDEYKKLMNCHIGNQQTTFKTRFHALERGDCLGSFKRDIAKLLCTAPEVKITITQEKNLLERYEGTTARTGALVSNAERENTVVTKEENNSRNWQREKAIHTEAILAPLTISANEMNMDANTLKQHMDTLLKKYLTSLQAFVNTASETSQDYKGPANNQIQNLNHFLMNNINQLEHYCLLLDKLAAIVPLSEYGTYDIIHLQFKAIKETIADLTTIKESFSIDKYGDPPTKEDLQSAAHRISLCNQILLISLNSAKLSEANQKPQPPEKVENCSLQ